MAVVCRGPKNCTFCGGLPSAGGLASTKLAGWGLIGILVVEIGGEFQQVGGRGSHDAFQ